MYIVYIMCNRQESTSNLPYTPLPHQNISAGVHLMCDDNECINVSTQ